MGKYPDLPREGDDESTQVGWSTHGLGYLKGKTAKQRVYVIHAYDRSMATDPNRRSPEARLEEALNLTAAIDVDLLGGEMLPLRQIRPSTFLGQGKIEEFRQMAQQQELDLFIFDGTLTPIQQRNLEKALETKVIDRTALILEIFGERAQTKEGELQVEYAHLIYQKSRLVRSWTHLERQRGGFGFMGGPGETQIEADRRIIDERLTRIRRQLDSVKKTRTLHRSRRQKAPYPVVALVGYTNAGKSTLFNRLTEAEVMAEDMLFATLDPTLRGITLKSGRKIILSDTVGFISELPTMLVAAFRATLEEVLEADIVIHVRDASHEDTDVQKEDVETVLAELGFNEGEQQARVLEALNKTDLLSDEERGVLDNLLERRPECYGISAVSGEGCDDLLDAVDDLLGGQDQILELIIPFHKGDALAWMKANARILSEETQESGIHISVQIDPLHLSRFQSRFKL